MSGDTLISAKSKGRPEADFVPARWWQAIPFLRMNFAIVRGIDPVADRILSRPWALSSLLEYAYLLRQFLCSDPYFILVSSERAGLLWMVRQSDVAFVFALGVLAPFQRKGAGGKAIAFIEDYPRRHRCRALITGVATGNVLIHRLIKIQGGRSLGLGTTTLELSPTNLPTSSPPEIEIRRIKRSEAIRAWKRWRLHEVEHVAGRDGVSVASTLLESAWLPQREYLALYQGEQEIGLALARRCAGELDIDLLPSSRFWSGPQTAELVAVIGSCLELPVRHLTLTQTHADALAGSAPFDFERDQEQERVFFFKLYSNHFET